MPLSPQLRAMQEEIEGYARDFGLDFYPVIFETLTPRQISEVAAYGGFPSRYPHWRFGQYFDGLHKGRVFGAQKIYEMVINNDPAYAYLLSTNTTCQNKMVMAHVMAHVDFFKNNLYFTNTCRTMIDEMANHASRVRRYVDRHGETTVEEFLDRALSLENLIDPGVMYVGDDRLLDLARPLSEEDEARMGPVQAHRMEAPGYLQRFVNPPEELKKEKERLELERDLLRKRFPREPIRDVLWFLIHYAPLSTWQKDILSMIRREAYYYGPQASTKIINEGWAAYWHSRIMTRKAMTDAEAVEFAELHAGVVRASRAQLNPYRLGMLLFRDIERRWDKGQFGPDWEECQDMARRDHFDTGAMQGVKKIFEVRRIHNDVTFVDEFLTPELVSQQLFFTYSYQKSKERYVISSREFAEIKDKIIAGLVNGGNPVIAIVDANFGNKGELLLKHRHQGVDLHQGFAFATLQNLHALWGRPVNLLTKAEDAGVIMRFDGRQTDAKKADYESYP